jgi:glutamine amidotransferase
MLTIIDYGLGNISAFKNVYERLNIPVKIAQYPKEVESATKLIIPGVGSFDYAMSQLNKSGMRDILDKRVLEDKIPVIGICVGMQILANSSEEGKEPGLGWINGRVRKFNPSLIPYKSQLPHMGWNTISPKDGENLFKGVENQSRFYFLHSYFVDCESDSNVICKTHYGISFASAVNKGNVYGIQFHPEKSHNNGIRLLNNFEQL